MTAADVLHGYLELLHIIYYYNSCTNSSNSCSHSASKYVFNNMEMRTKIITHEKTSNACTDDAIQILD